MTPGEIRNRLEKAIAEVSQLEQDVVDWSKQGAILAHPVRFEVTEAAESLERAIEVLDNGYDKAC